MVAPLKSLELTAAQVILKGSLSWITTWKMVAGTNRKFTHCYVMPNSHIVSIAPWCIAYVSQKGMGSSEAIAPFQGRNVIET